VIYRQLGEFATSFQKHTSEAEIESIDQKLLQSGIIYFHKRDK